MSPTVCFSVELEGAGSLRELKNLLGLGLNKESGRVPPNGEGSLFGLGFSTSLLGSLVVLLSPLSDLELLNRECLLLNLLRKLDFLTLKGEGELFGLSTSSISLDMSSLLSSFSVVLLTLDLNEGLLKLDNLEDNNFSLDDTELDADEGVVFGLFVISGLFPLFK